MAGTVKGARKDAPRRVAKREPRIFKAARLAAYCVVASAAIGLVAARSVYADAQKMALGLGAELGKIDDVGPGRAVVVNGQSIHVGSTTEAMSVHDVLDRTEEACKTGSAGLLAAFDAMSDQARKGLPPDATREKAAGVLRAERGGEGVVACLVGGEADREGFASRMQAFLATGDLAKIGKLRYVFAKPSGEGRTHLVSAWTDGSFDVFAMAPKDGADAPGEDAKLAPRVADSQRLLSAGVSGVPYGVYLYVTPQEPSVTRDRYARAMAALGFDAVADGGETPRAWEKAGSDVMVQVDERKGGGSTVTIVEMRNR